MSTQLEISFEEEPTNSTITTFVFTVFSIIVTVATAFSYPNLPYTHLIYNSSYL